MSTTELRSPCDIDSRRYRHPGSIHRQLPHIIGPRKPMIVVANKVDLLPPDARCGYLKRIKLVVEDAITKAGFREHFHVLHTALVSAENRLRC
ncbi:hypothetical protein KIN20_001224 [Parelaphostrongylus tenuis]|uniref:Uncharacterized protein n=1 Tax=Parelaphostrongylus tenuis TaxID=148309 RepID=A0AAD5LVV7_PARTN|nr:hypothetical protein KIN20_001224 [Parelaphostrongylus tenuis]